MSPDSTHRNYNLISIAILNEPYHTYLIQFNAAWYDATRQKSGTPRSSSFRIALRCVTLRKYDRIHSRYGAYLRNKLLETYCMKYKTFVWWMQHINKFQWNSGRYETRNICFMKYISRNSLIVLRGEILCNFKHCRLFCLFKWKITTNCVKYISLMCTGCKYIARNIFKKYVSYNMFHRSVPYLKELYQIWFHHVA